ncbi:MAG TPA: hypothetical protein VJ857_00345 [Methanocorpusculum sp.]|nr:hypothetical protein [Methanocorpusculum sp.]HJJ50704.1 hypothetical protein [Methanocorpusculum sp.]HKL97101.1 hypothetical protein [Methanocorpusculum sp.]
MSNKKETTTKTHNCETLLGEINAYCMGDGRKRSKFTKLVLGSGRKFR